jgi:hypothetical protein
MTEETPTLDTMRGKFAAIADADDEMVKDMASAMHLGTTLQGMIASITDAAKMMEANGLMEEGTIGTCTAVSNKETGVNYMINVSIADDEEMAGYEAALATARNLAEAGTVETQH